MKGIHLSKVHHLLKVKIKFSRIWKRVLAVCLVLAILFSVLLKFNVISLGSKSSASSQQRTARVTKGNLNVTVSGTGTIYSADSEELTPVVSGKITKMYFKVGDTVKKGDLIYEIDDTDAQSALEQAKNNLLQAQLSAKSSVKSVETLTMTAPFSGQVTSSVPKAEDAIQKGGNVLTVTDVSKMKLKLQFNGALLHTISVGQRATVNIQDIMQSVDGVVSSASSRTYSTSSGGEVFNVELIVTNPGSLKSGMTANAEVTVKGSSQSSVTTGTLEYIQSKVLKSDAGGTVESTNVSENDFVNAGDVLVKISNDDAIAASESTSIKLQDLEQQVETAQKKLSYYKIYSSIDGLIVTQKSKVGDTVGSANGSSSTVPCTIIDNKNYEFDVSIDELDIEQIQAGQKVSVTVDAISETATTPLEGEVVNAALQGISSNGVSTYPVTIKVSNPPVTMKSGMNASAEIMVSQKSNVLMVPVEAVQKMGNRSMVWARSAGSSTQTESVPNGFGGPDGGTMPNRSSANGSSGNNSGTASGAQPGGVTGDTQGSTSGSTAAGNTLGSSPSSKVSGSGSGNMPSGFPSGSGSRSASKSSGYYSGAVLMPVETGISNDSSIEITNGLSEGQTVILPQASSSSSSTSSSKNQRGNNSMGMSGFGGGPGGPPN